MVYILEDDRNILDLILYALKSQNIESCGFDNVKDFYEALKVKIPQVLVLDVMLPDESGFSILQKLKENPNTRDISVLILSALSEEMDKVKGLELGACDYLSKPFGVMEFVARIRSILRRLHNTKKSLVFENLELDLSSHIVQLNGKNIHLTLKEFELLRLFLQNKNRVFSRDEILEILWGYSYTKESRTIDIHIKTLRAKLGDFSNYIQTIRGVGYKLSKDF